MEKNLTITLHHGKSDIRVAYADLRKAALVLRAYNHPQRIAIMDYIQECELVGKRPTVREIEFATKMEQGEVSGHLAVLRRANLVLDEPDGKYVHYSTVDATLKRIETMIEKLTTPAV